MNDGVKNSQNMGCQIWIFISITDKMNIINSMSSIKRKSTNQSRIDFQPHWQSQNTQLKFEAEANSRLRQQITKVSNVDSVIQTDIRERTALLKEKAVTLAKSLQNQKRKNLELQAIIRHMHYTREQQKIVQGMHRDDINFSSLDSLLRKIKKSEYDLEQMFSRLNDLNSKNREKKNNIDAFRTQRVIDSGIFLKLEKQLIDEQVKYEKLLIEKTLYQNQCDRVLQNYMKLKANMGKNQVVPAKNKSISMQKNSIQQQFLSEMPKVQYAKFTEIQIENRRKSLMTNPSEKIRISEDISDNYEYIVKKLICETGVQNQEQFLQYFSNIQNMNSVMYEQVNKLCDQIFQLNHKISDSKKQKSSKAIKYYEREPSLPKSQLKNKQSEAIVKEIERIQSELKKQKQELQQFLNDQQTKTLINIIGIKSQGIDLTSLQTFFSEVEKKASATFQSLQSSRSTSFSALKPKHRESQSKDQSIDELINKVKKFGESETIMMKQDFRKQYEQIKKKSESKLFSGKKKHTTYIKK